MKEQDARTFLAAGTHLCGTYLDSQMEHYIYKRKHGSISIMNQKRTWERLLLAACAIFAFENTADDRVISSRMLLPLELLLLLAALLPEPSLTRFRQPTRSHDFWWLLIPGLTTSLSQKPPC